MAIIESWVSSCCVNGELGFFVDCIYTTVIHNSATVSQWISGVEFYRRLLHNLVVGLDTEWRPSFSRYTEGQSPPDNWSAYMDNIVRPDVMKNNHYLGVRLSKTGKLFF